MSIQNVSVTVGKTNITKNPLRGDDKRVQTRFKYRPKNINILFIGESVPNNGTFFYHKDSNLFKATLEAFQKVFSDINQVNFLDRFKEMGFYIDDLCEEPVNQLGDKDRKTLRTLYEPNMEKRLELFKPKIIIYSPKTYLEKHIERMASKLKLEIPIHSLSFPGRPEHKKAYVEKLVSILESEFGVDN